MDAKGVNQADVAREFGVKPPSVSSDWLKFGRIDKKHYSHLVEYFGLPYEWWFGDAGADKKITDVMLHMLKMSESEKNRMVKEAFSDKKPEGNGAHPPKRASK
ncbi:hypothetical protein Slit_1941 [Sideroxydans lithotrophicus ES-1]|uniref:Uncharacterized protein n=2 Tax=Sideroxydans TaxID=314343 RepID=D5CT84_SIDLE|nr:hypothetical protein Slit_1941 [Sideroxydans lithotrophicus ES-1]